MSSSSSPTSTDWSQFYQHNLSGQAVAPSGGRTSMFGDRVSDATVLTTTVTSPTTQSPRGATHLNPEGRVTKPLRRRTRASRRTPTTLLNTDTTNFRAMVQQFTGSPIAPFGSVSQPPGATSFNFGLLGRQQIVNPTAAAHHHHLMVPSPSPSGYHIQFQQQQPPHQQQPPRPHQQQPQYMFPLGNTPQHERLGNMGVSDHGFVMEGISSHAPTRPSSSNHNSNNNNYMF